MENRKLLKKLLVVICLATFILPEIFYPVERAAAQVPDLEDCWEDQTVDFPGQVITLAPKNITLVSFCIKYFAATDEVKVTWETGTEIDTAGFYIQRSEQENGTYQRITDFIYTNSPAPPAGATYEYKDLTAGRGRYYYYKLEEIDINNIPVSLTGPVVFDFYSPTRTPTSTPTITRTPTRTATAAFSEPTNTKTVTPLQPTSTRTRPTATSPSRQVVVAQQLTPTPTTSPSPSATIESGDRDVTEPITATATLEPLPPVMLLFPAPTETPVPSVVVVTPVATIVARLAESPLDVDMQAEFSNRVKVMGSIILVLWIILGVFLILYLRKASGHS